MLLNQTFIIWFFYHLNNQNKPPISTRDKTYWKKIKTTKCNLIFVVKIIVKKQMRMQFVLVTSYISSYLTFSTSFHSMFARWSLCNECIHVKSEESQLSQSLSLSLSLSFLSRSLSLFSSLSHTLSLSLSLSLSLLSLLISHLSLSPPLIHLSLSLLFSSLALSHSHLTSLAKKLTRKFRFPFTVFVCVCAVTALIRCILM